MNLRLVRLILGALFVFAVLHVFFPQDGNKPKAEDARTVTIYSALPPEKLQKIALEFEKVSGIKVLYVSLPPQEILPRIRMERALPQADVWLGAGVESLLQAQKESLLQKYTTDKVQDIPENWRDHDNYWMGLYIDVPVFVTNKDLFARQQIDPPRAWDDILNPMHRNKISLADPVVSHATFSMFAAIQQQLGQEEAFAYFAKLHENIQHYAKGAAVPGRMVAMGEASVGILGANDALKYMREGFPLIITFTQENMGYQLFGAGMISGAPHSQEAKIFMDWLVAKEGQESLLSGDMYYYPTNRAVKPSPELLFFKDLNFAAYDILEAAEEKAMLIEKWNTEVRVGLK